MNFILCTAAGNSNLVLTVNSGQTNPNGYNAFDTYVFVCPETNPEQMTINVKNSAGSPMGALACFRGIPAGGPRTLIGDECSEGNVVFAQIQPYLNNGSGGFLILNPAMNMPTQNTRGYRTAALWAYYNQGGSGNPWLQAGISGTLSIETGNNGVIGFVSGSAASDAGQACDITVFRTVNGVSTNIADTGDYFRRVRSAAGASADFSFNFFDNPDAGQPPAASIYDIRFRAAFNLGSSNPLAYINRNQGGEPTGGTSILLQEAQGQ